MGSATFRAFAQPPFLPTPLSASSSDAAAVFLSQARALTQQMAEPFASEARRQAQEYVARLTPNPVCFPSPKAPGPPPHAYFFSTHEWTPLSLSPMDAPYAPRTRAPRFLRIMITS